MLARLRDPRVVRGVGALLLSVGLAACSSSTEHTSTATTFTEPPGPTPKEISESLLKGDVAFLGPIYTVPVGHITMAYRQFGVGSDLVLISSQGSSMSLWPVAMLRILAQKHRVTIYDNRDLGNTTVTKGPFTLPDLADDAARLIAVLGLDHPAVFGWSTGDEIGLLLAARHTGVLSVGTVALSRRGTFGSGAGSEMADSLRPR